MFFCDASWDFRILVQVHSSHKESEVTTTFISKRRFLEARAWTFCISTTELTIEFILCPRYLSFSQYFTLKIIQSNFWKSFQKLYSSNVYLMNDECGFFFIFIFLFVQIYRTVFWTLWVLSFEKIQFYWDIIDV